MSNGLVMLHMKLPALFLLTLFFGMPICGIAQRNGDQSPGDMFKAAHAWVEAGDVFFEQSLTNEAFDAYMDALSGYEKIKNAHPKWNPDIVGFRIKYCHNLLERLLSGRSGQASNNPPPDAWVGIKWSSSLLEQKTTGKPVGFDQVMKTAAACENNGDFESALKFFEQAIGLDTNSLAAMHGAGRCCLSLGFTQRGRDILLAAFARDTENMDTILLLASLACAERDYKRALRTLASAEQQSTEHPRAQLLIGVAQMGLGRLDLAEEAWLAAVALDPKLSEAHYNLTRLMLVKNPTDLSGARKHYMLSLQAGGAHDEHLDKLFESQNQKPPPTRPAVKDQKKKKN